MNGVQCPASDALVPEDATDGNGVLYGPCPGGCAGMVVTDTVPDGERIREHRPRTIAGQLGTAEHLLARVAEAMAPAPGGRVRVFLAQHTAERIKAFVDDRHAEMYRRMVDANESLPEPM